MPTAPVRRLDANGDKTYGRGLANYATGAEATRQRLTSRLRLILGEWFLDTDAGIPWWQPEDSGVRPIMGGRPDFAYTEALVKAAILGTDGIATLRSFSMSFDSSTRRLTIQATVTTVDDDSITVSVVSP